MKLVVLDIDRKLLPEFQNIFVHLNSAQALKWWFLSP